MPIIVKKTEFEPDKCNVKAFDEPLAQLWEHIKTLKAEFNVSIIEALVEEYETCRLVDYYERNPDVAYDEVMEDAQRADISMDLTGRVSIAAR